MLSNASMYAINAVLFLALDTHKGRKIGAKEIAEDTNIPVPFLAKLLQELARKGVIASPKDPKGGFYLTEENKSQKLKECVLGLHECNSRKPCPIHEMVQPLRRKFLSELHTNSIATFAKNVEEGKAFLNI